MRIGGGGSTDINLLQSDASQFRNQDYVVSQSGAFQGIFSVGALAANISHAQIYNPSGSGITVIVDGIVISSNAVGSLEIASYATELTTSAGAWANTLFGGAAGSGIIRTQQNGSALGTIVGVNYMAALAPWEIWFRYPVQLQESNGLIVRQGGANAAVVGTIYGREI